MKVEAGYVCRVAPVRDPYGLRQYLCNSSTENPVGITSDLQQAEFFTDESKANSVAYWQHGLVVIATRQGNRIKTFAEPEPVRLLPRGEETARRLGFSLQ